MFLVKGNNASEKLLANFCRSEGKAHLVTYTNIMRRKYFIVCEIVNSLCQWIANEIMDVFLMKRYHSRPLILRLRCYACSVMVTPFTAYLVLFNRIQQSTTSSGRDSYKGVVDKHEREVAELTSSSLDGIEITTPMYTNTETFNKRSKQKCKNFHSTYKFLFLSLIKPETRRWPSKGR